MSKQQVIREELKKTETAANFYAREVAAAKNETWYRTVKNRYVHFQMRRTFLIRLLLKVQLKEFNRV